MKNERSITAWLLAPQKRPALPLTVTLVRVGPSNGLDDDNLAGSLKGVRDQVASWLKVDDRDPRVSWCYDQRCANAWTVEVEFEATPTTVDQCAHCGGLGFTRRAA